MVINFWKCIPVIVRHSCHLNKNKIRQKTCRRYLSYHRHKISLQHLYNNSVILMLFTSPVYTGCVGKVKLAGYVTRPADSLFTFYTQYRTSCYSTTSLKINWNNVKQEGNENKWIWQINVKWSNIPPRYRRTTTLEKINNAEVFEINFVGRNRCFEVILASRHPYLWPNTKRIIMVIVRTYILMEAQS